jgi:hypothetical protein
VVVVVLLPLGVIRRVVLAVAVRIHQPLVLALLKKVSMGVRQVLVRFKLVAVAVAVLEPLG